MTLVPEHLPDLQTFMTMAFSESSIAVATVAEPIEGVSIDAEKTDSVSLAASVGGRVSGKSWKVQKTATVCVHIRPNLRVTVLTESMHQPLAHSRGRQDKEMG